MIDWLTFIAPLEHRAGLGGPFWNGEVMSTCPDPELGESIEWAKLKRMPLVGSYSCQVFISSTTDAEGRPAIHVSGNPAKWFQGHNVFGSDDLPGLVVEMLLRICATVGVVPSDQNMAAWCAGLIALLRVDVTNSWDLGNRARVRAALKALDSTAHLKHRGRGHFYGDALTFGGGGKNNPGSRRWSLTLYAKGPELEVHPLPLALVESSLPAFADGHLRAEVRMLSLELKREELHLVSAWGDNTAQELHARKFSGLQVSDTTMLQAQVLEGLPGRLQGAHQLWRDGHDLRAIFSRATFYRYRTELMRHGVDIAVSQPKASSDSNVVPLRVVLNAHPVVVPSWATGTPLYFEPRARFG